MENIRYSPEIDAILSVGLSLSEFGTNSWALTKEQALAALQKFKLTGTPILGLDVLKLENGIIDYTYDSSSYDRSDQESLNDYINNSINRAINYIEAYPSEIVSFDLVPDIIKNSIWLNKIYKLKTHIEETGSEKSYIQMIFLCWELLVERGVIDHDIPDAFLENKLHEYYKTAAVKFDNSPVFLFYVGWMLEIAFGYFAETDDSLGKSMMLKAHALDPQNKLYAWACAPYLNIERSAINIPVEEFEGLGDDIQEYFTKIVGQR